MSYLNAPRLVFSGDFLASPSTINNVAQYYNNDTFSPIYQEVGEGGWNPEGEGAFDLKNCKVQQYELSNGTIVKAKDALNDPIFRCEITGSEGRASGKIVDLDPDMQMASQIWAFQLRILDDNGEVLAQGNLEVTPFRDINFSRNILNPGMPGAGANYISTINKINWSENLDQYPILKELKAKALENTDQLSINLNVFAYCNDINNPRFNLGKVVGSIGAWYEGDPINLTSARRLVGTGKGELFNTTLFTYDEIVVDEELGKKEDRLVFDFGQSFPIKNMEGDINAIYPVTNKNYNLVIGVCKTNKEALTPTSEIKFEDFIEIGEVNYKIGDQANPKWVLEGGYSIFTNLSEEAKKRISNHPIVLFNRDLESNTYQALAVETQNGYIVEADNFVQRVDYLDDNAIQPYDMTSAPVNIYVYQWGKPLTKDHSQIKIKVSICEPSKLESQVLYKLCKPAHYLNFNNHSLDDHNPNIELPVILNNPTILNITGNKILEHPRTSYLDGQMYFMNISCIENGVEIAKGRRYFDNHILNENHAKFTGVACINVHLRTYVPIPNQPNWDDDLADTMQQFSNLYPIMSKYIADLGNKEDVLARRDLMLFAFTQPIHSTLHMPVTRDLSNSKRAAIIKWLENSDTTPKA